MKNKFETQEGGSMLGATIQQVRKAKKITQEELGKRVGLPKSSISKIEKGLTHISFEDASLLMDAMGEKISISRRVLFIDGTHTPLSLFNRSTRLFLTISCQNSLLA